MRIFKPIFFLTGFFFLLWSCEGFMRDPEAPQRPSEDHFIPPTDPGIVFTNLRNAFAYREHDVYSRCFSDSTSSGIAYTYEAAPVKAGVFPAEWDAQNELIYFQELLSACPEDSLLLLEISNDEVPVNDEGDSVRYQINYHIVAQHTRRGYDSVFNGNSVIKLLRNNRNYWVIYFWQDIPVSSDATWSDLKAYFY
ncbi:MAG: hypothetical protein U5N26_04300 [Candidatus Marinimicrobia bacterium]|nr:hypothetical protein [Candidatus Neomarinimicrobiota bacterium]